MDNIFHLRKLELKDAPFMLEWMHDDSVVHFMGKNFANMQLSDCENFIKSCSCENVNVHRAIVADDDVYLGTVSLKNINIDRSDAEFAITIRKSAMARGVSSFAIRAIIEYGLRELGLKDIYWYVSKENIRAVKFYDKNGYQRVEPDQVLASSEIEDPGRDYIWYMIENTTESKSC